MRDCAADVVVDARHGAQAEAAGPATGPVERHGVDRCGRSDRALPTRSSSVPPLRRVMLGDLDLPRMNSRSERMKSATSTSHGRGWSGPLSKIRKPALNSDWTGPLFLDPLPSTPPGIRHPTRKRYTPPPTQATRVDALTISRMTSPAPAQAARRGPILPQPPAVPAFSPSRTRPRAGCAFRSISHKLAQIAPTAHSRTDGIRVVHALCTRCAWRLSRKALNSHAFHPA